MPDAGTTPHLSVVVITKDEETDLPGFLENMSSIADEIVIIDDGSTDRTEEIARSFPGEVRFIRSPRGPDEGFCHQRQKGVEAARGEWLLQVDCDMRLTPELAAEIRSAIREPDKNGYRFRLAQYFMNRRVRYGGFQYWNQPWLSRRSATRWSQKVHERIGIEGGENAIGQLSHRMIHLNDNSFLERLRKNRDYSRFEAERILSSGRPVTIFRMLSQAAWRSFRSYVVMRGFLDGRLGLVWALYQFTGTLTPYYLAWSELHSGSREEVEKQLRQAFATRSF